MAARTLLLLFAAATQLPERCAAQYASVPLPPVPWSTGVFGTGQAVADFDGDGDMDVIVAPSPGAPIPLLRNDGGLSFSDVGSAAQLGTHPSPLCVVAADVDNDGDQDVFMGGQFVPGRLYINNGAGVFSEQAVARGIVHAGDNYAASFGDYDRDGWLDLYLGNRLDATFSNPGTNRLYRNTGGGHFVDVTAQAGVAGYGLSFAVAFLDFDEDGWPDLLEIRDKGTAAFPNELFRNNGDGTFTAVGPQVGVNYAVDGMGVDFVDAFNDGGVDFFCTDGTPANLFHVWDPVTATYTEDAATFGLQGTGVVWACHFFDYDNDGWQDLYTVQESAPNQLYINPGTGYAAGQPWTDVAAQVGLAQPRLQFCASVGDFDDDGRVDIFNRYNLGVLLHPNGVELLRNTAPGGNWLKLHTVGRVGNRDGLGARVEVTVQGQTQRQWVRSGVGFQSSNDPRLNFGLGAAATVDRVHVTWPSGQHQYVTDVAANQILELREPTLTGSGPAPVGGAATVSMSVPGDEGLPYMLLLSFSSQVGIPLGNQTLPIDFDALTAVTLDPLNPFFVGSVGALDANGDASATLFVPPIVELSGLTVYAGGFTTDPVNFPLVRTVLQRAVAIPIQ